MSQFKEGDRVTWTGNREGLTKQSFDIIKKITGTVATVSVIRQRLIDETEKRIGVDTVYDPTLYRCPRLKNLKSYTEGDLREPCNE